VKNNLAVGKVRSKAVTTDMLDKAFTELRAEQNNLRMSYNFSHNAFFERLTATQIQIERLTGKIGVLQAEVEELKKKRKRKK
jgi:hypothetical protein